MSRHWECFLCNTSAQAGICAKNDDGAWEGVENLSDRKWTRVSVLDPIF